MVARWAPIRGRERGRPRPVAPACALEPGRTPLEQVKRLEDQLDLNPAGLRFTILVVKIVFLCHLIACAWMFMHTIVDDRRAGWAGAG